MMNFLSKNISEEISLLRSVINNSELLEDIDNLICAVRECIQSGHKIITCGNGGSAADAQHLVAELIGHYKIKRNPFPAVCLNSDNILLTALANDYGFDNVFLRQLYAIGRKGDLLLLISTSGNSNNLISVANVARKLDIKSAALLGRTGGNLGLIVDIPVVFPSSNAPRIQEVHTIIIHTICDYIEYDKGI